MSETPLCDELSAGDVCDYVSAWLALAEHLERALTAAESELETVKRERDEAVTKSVLAESNRWGDRLNWVHQQYDVDGSGCDSGDELDVIETEISLALGNLTERAESAESLSAQRGDALREAKSLENLGYNICYAQSQPNEVDETGVPASKYQAEAARVQSLINAALSPEAPAHD